MMPSNIVVNDNTKKRNWKATGVDIFELAVRSFTALLLIFLCYQCQCCPYLFNSSYANEKKISALRVVALCIAFITIAVVETL